ncbi:hypothetical protein [Citrobacter sp. CFNIH10]|uniref:gp53-like domain-containing protein n=1 Tax=Citrobacter sp. CFNIH10 TaxID=1920110 RepID=UPI001FF0A9D5|nr:hypothetical protein [Citrobacter sp. CFNIH10]
MFHVDNSTGVPVMPQPSPVTSEAELFFTEGGNGTPPTYPGPDWFNIVQSELLNVVRTAGISPDKMDSTQLLAALGMLFLQRNNPFGDIAQDGPEAIATALSNLGLGTAALRDVGTGENQIPDMSAFSYLTPGAGQPGYTFLPNGILLQWGTILPSASDISTSFPILFPTTIFAVLATSGYTAGVGTTGVSSIGAAINPSVRGSFVSRNTSPTLGGRFLAIGN